MRCSPVVLPLHRVMSCQCCARTHSILLQYSRRLGMAAAGQAAHSPPSALPSPPRRCCSLHSNALPELPPELGRLTECVRLSLYQNRLSGLPAEIGDMSALQVREATGCCCCRGCCCRGCCPPVVAASAAHRCNWPAEANPL